MSTAASEISDDQDARDRVLVARLRGGDRAAFGELYEHHEPVVSRRLRRILGARADVEEVVQTTFTEAYRSLGRYQLERPFAPWLLGVAVRQARNFLRARARRSWLVPWQKIVDESPNDDAAHSSSEAQVIQHQRMQLLFRAMEGLPTNKRIAFALHELEGLGLTEIGNAVGASPQTVRARVLSARRLVEKRIAKLTGQRRRVPSGGVAP